MIFCNAKLNLYLKILGKRDDGYHQLNMINVPVSFYDEMNIDIYPGDSKLVQNFRPELSCSYDKTTIYKAYMLLKTFIPENITIEVSVKKIIPEGAGMGGGSSNAAFFINELVKRFNIKLTEELISKIAFQVGADVPFFIYNKPAFLEGIGERVFPYRAFPTLNLLVIKPDFSVNTKWAYSLVKCYSQPDDFNKDIMTQKELLTIMTNDLEKPVEEKYFEIKKIKNFLYNNDALKAMMTGSGSSVFGIFKSCNDLDRAYLKAEKTFLNYKVIKAKTIGA